MSRRISSWRWTLSVVWSLLFAASVQADPPKAKPTPPMPVDREAAQVLIEAVIYEVDPAKLVKFDDKSKSPVAELLKKNGFKLAKRDAIAHAVRDEPLSLDLKDNQIGLAFKRVAEPTVVTLAKHAATVLSGGEFPVPVSNDKGEIGIGFREFGSKLTVLPLIEADGRIAIDVQVEESTVDRNQSVEVNGISVPGLRVRRMSFAAKLKSGQHVLIANGTTESDLTQFVQLKARVLTTDEVVQAAPVRPAPLPNKTKPANAVEAAAASPAKTDEEFIVEDRWPIQDVKVGQMVGLMQIHIRKTHMYSKLSIVNGSDDDAACKVIAVEERPNGEGRRITLRPWSDDEKKRKTCAAELRSQIASAASCCVVPVDGATGEGLIAALFQSLDAVPEKLAPKPIELVVGGMFRPWLGKMTVMDQLGSSVTRETDPKDTDWSSFVAQQCGLTSFSLIHRDGVLASRMVFLVKTDTRELELHLKQHFPTAKVTITSLGANSLMLNGTVASEEDSQGIVELAEQFAPKVLNRLKVTAALSANEPRRMGTPARPAVVQIDEPQIATEAIPVKPINAGTDKSAHPPRVLRASATSSKKTDQLRELLDEIRELRRDVRSLNERLERERPEINEPPKAASPIGQERSTTETGAFDKLVSSYNKLMDQRRYAEAEVIAKEAKELDPNSPVAEAMRWKAVFSRRMADEEKQRTTPNTIPPHNAEWTRADSVSQEPLTVGVTDAERAAAAKLDQVVVWEMVDLPLSKAVQHLATDVGINIVLDKQGLEDAGVTPDTRVSRTLKGVNLRSALRIVLEPLKLGYVFDGEVLKITSCERADGPAVVVAYPVADLIGTTNAFNDLRVLQELIMVTVRSEKEWVEPNNSMPKILGVQATKSLVVRHTRAVHAEVATFLELLRKTKRLDASAKDAATAHLTEEELRIIEKLRTRISLHFDNAPLKQVAEQLAKQNDFNIVLDAAGLEDVSVKLTTPVTIQLDQVRLATALRLLLEPLQLDYLVKHSVLQITSRQRAEGEFIVATYPVADFLFPTDHGAVDFAELPDLLMSMVEPNSWDVNGGGATVRTNALTRLLVVRQTSANHARIRELLESLRKLKVTVTAPRDESSTADGQTKVERPTTMQPQTKKSSSRGAMIATLAANDATHVIDDERRFIEKFATKISVHFEQAPLKQIIEHIAKSSDLNIVLDSAGLEEEGLTTSTPVSLNLDQIRTANVLRLLLEPLNLDYVLKDDVLQITSRARAVSLPILATYSVADLVVPIQPLQLRYQVEGNKSEDVKPAKPTTVGHTFAQLRELITSCVAPNSWSQAGGNGEMTFNESTLSLVVRQSPAAHGELRDLLEQLRRLQDQQVSLEFRVIKTDENFHGFGFDLPMAWTQLKSNEALSLSTKEAESLIAAAQKEKRTSLLSAPKVTLMNGQPLTLEVNSDILPTPLHLSGFAMPLSGDGHRFARLHLMARGSDERSAASNLTTLRDGHSLLINLTDVLKPGPQAGIPVLNKVPHVDRLFKNVSATKPLKPGERLFLLATPCVIVQEEEESLLGVPK